MTYFNGVRTEQEAAERFRELAQRYNPNVQANVPAFREMREEYERVTWALRNNLVLPPSPSAEPAAAVTPAKTTKGRGAGKKKASGSRTRQSVVQVVHVHAAPPPPAPTPTFVDVLRLGVDIVDRIMRSGDDNGR